MNPYRYVVEAVANGESLLSLCCGIGFELGGLNTSDVTAVDIAPQYLAEVTKRCPQAKLVESDAISYITAQPDSSVDVISLIDGLEHMDKETGRKLLPELKRVCRKQIVLFVPSGLSEDGYLKNEPHDAWGISGADEHQKHLSGWTVPELEAEGFTLVDSADDISQHGEPYRALMFRYQK